MDRPRREPGPDDGEHERVPAPPDPEGHDAARLAENPAQCLLVREPDRGEPVDGEDGVARPDPRHPRRAGLRPSHVEPVLVGQKRHSDARVGAGRLPLQEPVLRRVEELGVGVVECCEHLAHVVHAQDPLRHLAVVARCELRSNLRDDARGGARGGACGVARTGVPTADRGKPQREGADDGHREAQDPGRAPQAGGVYAALHPEETADRETRPCGAEREPGEQDDQRVERERDRLDVRASVDMCRGSRAGRSPCRAPGGSPQSAPPQTRRSAPRA